MPDPRRSARIANNQLREPPVVAGMVVAPIPALERTAQEDFLAAAIPPSGCPSTASTPLLVHTGQLPGNRPRSTVLGSAIAQELKNDTSLASDSFIDRLFPEKSAPFTIGNAVFKALAKAGYWNHTTNSFQKMGYTEQALGEWLNAVGTTMGTVHKRTPDRLWWHGTCNLPPSGAPDIPRKPDLVLLSRKHQEAMVAEPQRINWIRIRSFAEVTRSSRIPATMTPTINAKSYLLFLLQFDRRFVTALSFIGSGEYSLTVTDREGQIRYTSSLKTNGLEPARRFLTILSFLMFGRDSDIGLDSHFIRNPDSDQLTAVFVENSRYELGDRIYSVESLLGRGTNVWIVTRDDKSYILKDFWMLERLVESETNHLKAMVGHPQLESLIPTYEAGGDIKFDGITDSTVNYRGSDLLGRPGNRRVHQRSVISPIGKPLTSFQSKKEFVRALIDVVGGE